MKRIYNILTDKTNLFISQTNGINNMYNRYSTVLLVYGISVKQAWSIISTNILSYTSANTNRTVINYVLRDAQNTHEFIEKPIIVKLIHIISLKM